MFLFRFSGKTLNFDLSNWDAGTIHWTSLKEGMERAREEEKPVMLVVHKHRCPASDHLRKCFATSDQVNSLASNFVMVHMDSENAKGINGISSDEKLFPKIMFFDPYGNHIPTVKNFPAWKRYMFSFTPEREVVNGMTEVKSMFLKKKPRKLPTYQW